MTASKDLRLTNKESHKSPVGYMLRKTALVTTALTVAGASWYYAVGMTSGSDLTAIYNCSAFFAYAFSIPLLGDELRFDKAFAVAVAIAGVMTIAYGDSKQAGEGAASNEASNRTVGNIVIGIGSVLYGLYEVLYKKMACPPDGVSLAGEPSLPIPLAVLSAVLPCWYFGFPYRSCTSPVLRSLNGRLGRRNGCCSSPHSQTLVGATI